MWCADSHSEQGLVEGASEEGIQQVLMHQCQAQDSTRETEPEAHIFGQSKQEANRSHTAHVKQH